MKQRRGLLERFAEGIDLPGEAFPRQTLVELAGDCRVLVENHGGITEYGREKISVQVRYGMLCVCGGGLEVVRMTKEQLVISGRIDGVTLHRRG